MYHKIRGSPLPLFYQVVILPLISDSAYGLVTDHVFSALLGLYISAIAINQNSGQELVLRQQTSEHASFQTKETHFE